MKYARENASRVSHDYRVNDYVFLLQKDIRRKLDPIKLGPFRVVQVHSNGNVTIQRSPLVTERVNIRRICPTRPSQD